MCIGKIKTLLKGVEKMVKNQVVVRTASDLEKKYNFAQLLGLKKNVEITAQGMQKIENELNNMLNALVINLKDVLDSQSEISLWFYSGKPTTKNEPYTTWSNPNDHVGDIYYDQKTGSVYQWNGKVWEVNTSPDLIEAMAITNAEIDTSTDHERKVFFDTPTIPYSNGDWWIKEDGTLYICQISKSSGAYETADFIESSNYTESFAEKIGEELKVLKGTITIISENYAKFTDLATGGSTVINGDNITTGNIQSQNYIQDVSGTKISLETGTIDSKNFKTDAEGNMTCSNATITGGKISITSPDYTPVIELIASLNGVSTKKTMSAASILTTSIYEDTKLIKEMAFYTPDQIEFLEMDSTGSAYENAAHIGYSHDSSNFGEKNETAMFLLAKNKVLLAEIGETCSWFKNLRYDTLSATSLENQKKNFVLFDKGLELVKNSDIYSYNLKDESDEAKKHIGVVIGEGYNTPAEILSNDNQAVDLYSMISVAYKAIQEQQEMIDQLKEEIKVLKEG